jgi:CRISPR type III-B/RAMP module-associated protein Cmr5
MQNLDQIRADNTLLVARVKAPPPGVDPPNKPDEKAVDKLPAMIVNNGLLAAAAFALKKGEGLADAMDAVAWHLSDLRIGRLPSGCRRSQPMLNHLAGTTSDRLRLATDEALAFLSYLKRLGNSED